MEPNGTYGKPWQLVRRIHGAGAGFALVTANLPGEKRLRARLPVGLEAIRKVRDDSVYAGSPGVLNFGMTIRGVGKDLKAGVV